MNNPMEEQSDKALKSRLGLEQTRLRRINDDIRHLTAHMEALRLYGELTAEYDALKTKLTEVRRQEAMLAPEASQMKRYESVEAITTPVVRLCLMREYAKDDMLQAHDTQSALRDAAAEMINARKQVSQRITELENKLYAMEESVELLQERRFQKGSLQVLETIIKDYDTLANQMMQRKAQNAQSIRGLKEQIAVKTKELERVKADPVTAHAKMLGQISVIMPRLQSLQILMTQRRQMAKRIENLKADIDKETSVMTLLRDKTQMMDVQIQRQLETIAALRNSDSEDITVKKERIAAYSKTVGDLTAERNSVFRQIDRLNISYEVHLEQLDQYRAQKEKAEESYLVVHDGLDHMITLPDWHTTFEKDPTILMQRIEEIRLDWEAHNEQMNSLSQAIDIFGKILTEKNEQQQQMEDWTNQLGDELVTLNHQRQQLKAEVNNVAPDGSQPEDYYQRRKEMLEGEMKGIEKYVETYQDTCREACRTEGRLDALQQMDNDRRKRMEQMQNQVDQWLHAYCTQHTPLQYVQLEEILTGEHPWSKYRDDVMQNKVDVAVTEARAEDLKARIERLENEIGAMRAEELSSQLAKDDMELENLIKEQMETALKLARLEMQIRMDL